MRRPGESFALEYTRHAMRLLLGSEKKNKMEVGWLREDWRQVCIDLQRGVLYLALLFSCQDCKSSEETTQTRKFPLVSWCRLFET